VNRNDQLAEQFARERGHLRAIAYRMLGSVTEADDAVQEAWVRLDRHVPERPEDLRGWLTVVVSRICLDMLRARRSRREDYAGTWLPEPIVTPIAPDDPERDAVMADSVGIALLVVLEQLTPAERLAFVLHDVFSVPFEEIAQVLDRTPTATRQLASRARRRVRGAAPSADADLRVQRRVVDAFLAAARAGDFEALVRVLDPDVVLRTDGGGTGVLARPAVAGASEVARQLQLSGPRFAALAHHVIVNGGPGVVVDPPGQPRVVIAFGVTGGRIATIDLIGDPAKLRGLGRSPWAEP
jgi:RNA polymerase sigma-70 factor (ECF subfamily)